VPPRMTTTSRRCYEDPSPYVRLNEIISTYRIGLSGCLADSRAPVNRADQGRLGAPSPRSRSTAETTTPVVLPRYVAGADRLRRLQRRDHSRGSAFAFAPVVAAGRRSKFACRPSDGAHRRGRPRRSNRQVLWTARPLAPSATRCEAYKGDHLVASFTSEAIDRWQVVSDAEQPLLMIEALCESEVRCGADEQDTLRDAIATCARFTINEPLSTPPKRTEIKTLENRLRAISQMASRHDAGANPELSKPVSQARSARESLKLASRSQDYGRRFGVSISALARWADQYPGTLIDSLE
jgi:hypothetical protein